MHSAYGQGNFEVGTRIIGAGLGFGNTYGGLHGSQSPAISLHYEQGIWDIDGPGVISLGGYFAYKSYSYDYIVYSLKLNHTLIGIRSAYHYNGLNTTDWDVYGGVMLAYRISSVTDNDPYSEWNYNSGLVFSVYLGGRYYFSETVAGFAELGSGISVLSLGVAFQF